MATIKKDLKQKAAKTAGSLTEKQGTEERKPIDSTGDDCRCKEVSEKTLPEMFRLMIKDLSFWKKAASKK